VHRRDARAGQHGIGARSPRRCGFATSIFRSTRELTGASIMLSKVLAQLRLTQKFLVLGAIVLAALGWTIWLLVSAANESIDFSAKERLGVEYHRAVVPYLRAVQAYRGASASLASGGAAVEAAARRVDEAAAAVDAVDARLGAELTVSDAWKRIRADWASARGGDFARQSAYAAEVLGLLDAIGDNSNLVLDPDLDSFYVMSAAVTHLPHMVEASAATRGVATGVLVRGAIRSTESAELLERRAQLGLRARQLGKAIAQATAATPALKAKFEAPLRAQHDAIAAMTAAIDQRLLDTGRSDLSAEAFFALGSRAVDAQYATYDATIAALDDLLAARIRKLAGKRNGIVGTIAVVMILLVAAAFVVIRNLVSRIAAAAVNAADIAEGRLDGAIDTVGRDEVARLNRAFSDMQRKLRESIERDRAMLAENLRIREALEASTTNLRVCDDDGRILFANRAFIATARTLEADVRVRQTGFSADTLVGGDIAALHGDPQATLGVLRNLDAAHRTTETIAGRTFEIVTHPIRNADGQRIGNVAEWTDRTEQLAAEAEMAGIIEAASRGNLGNRLATDSLTGFYRAVGNDINRLLDTLAHGLGEVARVMEGLGEGDLSQRMEGSYEGVFADLQRDIDRTMERVGALIGQIREGSESIRTAAQEISQGNTDLSSRTEEQASSLEETASSMEELTNTVRVNAESAKQAKALVIGAAESAERGGETVRRVVATMTDIAASSKRIQDIIGVIDGIAFQTNILALNAAVEAARAGEQGRGFAVVASEVRNLAQRSATAAREIKELITESVSKVAGGTQLVDQAGGEMQEIVQSVKRVTDIMAEISAASAEQASGIEEVNTAVGQMDQTTQQNAALVEEAAAAAESLQEQSVRLLDAVATFKLRAEGAAPAPRAAAPAAAWDGTTERRGPHRAQNVARIPARQPAPVTQARAPKKAVGDDWSEF
jgi:methyl-accepting chemotaxis protein